MTQQFWIKSSEGEEAEGPINKEDFLKRVQEKTVLPETMISVDGSKYFPATAVKGISWPGDITAPSPPPNMAMCPRCKNTISIKATVCPKCELPLKTYVCEDCGSTYTNNDACPSCGAPPPVPSGSNASALKGTVQGIMTDLQSVSFKDEIVPVAVITSAGILKSARFWTLSLLGVAPIFLKAGATVKPVTLLLLFAIYFAIIWTVVFKEFVILRRGNWGKSIAVFFFTGLIGVPLLLKFYGITGWGPSINVEARPWWGTIFWAGCEEVVKIIPVVGYLVFAGKRADGVLAILIGVCSAFGFAAFENVKYQTDWLIRLGFAAGYGEHPVHLMMASFQNMINTLVRSISLIFGHAVWTGVFSYFAAVAILGGKRIVALIVIGLLTGSIIHAVYNYMCGFFPVASALVNVFGFLLFFAYLEKLRATGGEG